MLQVQLVVESGDYRVKSMPGGNDHYNRSDLRKRIKRRNEYNAGGLQSLKDSRKGKPYCFPS